MSSHSPIPTVGRTRWSGERGELFCDDFLQAQLPQVDVIFTDPPWNQAILNKFYKLAGRLNPHSYYHFMKNSLEKMVQLCPNGLLFLEFGRHAGGLATEMLAAMGIAQIAEGKYFYSDGIPYTMQLWTANPTAFPARINLPLIPRTETAQEFTNERLVWNYLATLLNLRNKTCLDPFCGECFNLEIAATSGMKFLGTELIPTKIARGAKRLHRFSPLTRID